MNNATISIKGITPVGRIKAYTLNKTQIRRMNIRKLIDVVSDLGVSPKPYYTKQDYVDIMLSEFPCSDNPVKEYECSECGKIFKTRKRIQKRQLCKKCS